MPPKRDTWRMWDCTFESDVKWRRLRADPANDFDACVGAFVILLSWRTLEGSPSFTMDDALLFTRQSSIDALTRVGLLTPDGFDPESWERWKPQRYPSEQPEAVRERVQRHREASRPVTTGHDTSRHVTSGNDSVTTGNDTTPPHPTLDSPHPIPSHPEPDDPPDALDRYYELTMRSPWGQESGRWLKRLEGDYGYNRTIAAMDAEWKASPTVKDFLGRVDARLARDAEKEKQRRQAERPKAKPSPTARDRRAELQELMKMMGGTKEGTDEQLRPVQATPSPDGLPRPQRERPPRA